MCCLTWRLHLQGFHSSDSDDQHSDDEEDHVEGMSGDEQMGEQQDFEGSDSFDEVCTPCRFQLVFTLHTSHLFCDNMVAFNGDMLKYLEHLYFWTLVTVCSTEEMCVGQIAWQHLKCLKGFLCFFLF